MPHFSTVTVVSLHEAEIIPTLGSSTRVENKYIFPITGNVQLTNIVPGAPVYIPHLHLVLGDWRASVVRGSLDQEYNVVQNIHMYVHCSIYVQKFCSSEYVVNISPKSMPCSFRIYIYMYVQNLCSKTYIWPLTDETTVLEPSNFNLSHLMLEEIWKWIFYSPTRTPRPSSVPSPWLWACQAGKRFLIWYDIHIFGFLSVKRKQGFFNFFFLAV